MSNNQENGDEKSLLCLIGPERLSELRALGLRPVVSLEPDGLSESQRVKAIEEVVENSHQRHAKAQRLAALGTMGAGLVHEARNALTGVLGFSQVAQRNEARREALLETIEEETKRALEKLSHFLSFARNQPKTATPFPINDVAARAQRATQHQLHVHEIALVLKPADEPIIVMGSSGEIEQVLLNLILNAQQASAAGSTVSVTVSPCSDDSVQITVRDQGSGIKESDLETIFTPFFTTKASGTGLGLAICKRIVEDHDGELNVESKLGVGTTFTVTLPIVSALAKVGS